MMSRRLHILAIHYMTCVFDNAAFSEVLIRRYKIAMNVGDFASFAINRQSM